jgi:hypothetical protein
LRLSSCALLSGLALLCFGVLAVAVEPALSAGSTLVWYGQASSSTGAVVTGPTLDAGVFYRIVAMNSWRWDVDQNYGADAMYYTTNYTNDVYWGGVHFPCPGGHSFLQVSGQDVNWGPFSDGEYNHTYTIHSIGNGTAVTFQIVDWKDGIYTNNQCHIDVYIYFDVVVGGRVADWTDELVAYFAVSGAVFVGAVGVPAVKRFRALSG